EIHAPSCRAPRWHERQGAARSEGAALGDSGRPGTPRACDRALHRQGLRRRAARHAFPRAAGLLEGNPDPVHRSSAPPQPCKSEVRIFDYVDRDVAMLLRMFEKRLRGYRAIGYARGESPLGYGESEDEVAIEYDQDVLRSLEDPADLT